MNQQKQSTMNHQRKRSNDSQQRQNQKDQKIVQENLSKTSSQDVFQKVQNNTANDQQQKVVVNKIPKKVNNFIEEDKSKEDRSINLNMNRKLLDLDDNEDDDVYNHNDINNNRSKPTMNVNPPALQKPNTMQNIRSKPDFSKTQQPNMKTLKSPANNSKVKTSNTNYSKPEYLSYDELEEQSNQSFNQLQ